ncbi:MAG: histidine kinase N-terminal 7TM domain-containing protein [Desulfoferrobacter sp.]
MSYSYSYNSDIWPALITLATTTYLGAYSWRRRHIPAAKPFAVACLLGGFWTLGVILELAAVDFPTKVFWVKFQAIWQLPVGTAITCFILKYAGLGRWLNRRTYALLFLFPLLSVLLMVTNEFHHLIWTGFRMNRYVVSSPGKLYWVFNSYVYLLGLVNFTVLVRLAICSPGHRMPVAIIVSGQIIARVGYTIDKMDTGLIGPGESVLFTVGLMSVVYALVVLRFHAIDPVAAARNAALQQMREGFIVLDLQDRIADVNPTAAAMLGFHENELRNKLLKDVMPIDADDLGQLGKKEAGQTDITLGAENSARQYRLNLIALKGRHGEVIGKLIMLHDVTEQIRAQTRILEQQSVVATLKERERLARELHDGIGQTLGYVGMQTQTALKWMHAGDDERAESLLRRLVEVAKDAHADVRESIFNLKTGSGRQWSFIPAVKEYVDKFQANYGIRTELACSAGIHENTFDSGTDIHLLRVIQEALTNARKHSGAHTVKVCLELNGNKAQITITDDGHGFDVSHSGGGNSGHFGLVFMRERMEQIGGSLQIVSTAGGGTVLKLNVPI